MALATQCPHCHTAFKVAHDQLKLRAGLVRCGACKQIFNGIENLVAPEQVAASQGAARPAPAPAPSPASSPLPSAAAVRAMPAPSSEAPATGVRLPIASDNDALKFVPLDDPDTETRILQELPATTVADTGADTDADTESGEDPLTRMTLVDFSLFDESLEAPQDDAEGDASTDANAGVNPDRETDTDAPGRDEGGIWPDTHTESAALPPAPVEQRQIEQELAVANATDIADADDSPPAPASADDDSGNGDAEIEAEEQAALEIFDTSAYGSQLADAQLAAAVDDVIAEDLADAALAAAAAEIDEPEFVMVDRRRQRRRRITRIGMAVGTAVLFAGALLQGAYVFRTDLAARFPASSPALTQMCELLGCHIGLPAQIDQVSIESSELKALKTGGNVFTLGLLLHNRSTLVQAWPHVELTLNDENGQALLRRVLTPQEYLPAGQDVTRGFSARTEQTVQVSFALQQLQASDYRVYLFYP